MEHALVEHDEARRTLLKVKEDSTEVHIVTETGEFLFKAFKWQCRLIFESEF